MHRLKGEETLTGHSLSALIIFVVISSPAAAHVEAGVPDGLLSGVLHPLTGIDHMLAMVAVGLWGAVLGAPAIWILPIAFPLVMALGGVLGVLGASVPQPELMIALSALVLGLAVALSVQVPVWLAGTVVAVFAVFHGYAHGQELPEAANPLAFGIGFVTATGALHAVGIALGLLTRWRSGAYAVRALGGVVTVFGVMFLRSALLG